jgi:hypothetical protein
MTNLLVDWPDDAAERVEREAFIARHAMHRSELFSEDALVRLMDTYPRQRLQVFTMGKDPTDLSAWTPVDTTGASGAELMQAIRVGRLWAKLMRLDIVAPEYGALVQQAYGEIADRIPERPLLMRPLMLISSPGALVYYHADAHSTMLWQISGVKRVWIYPAGDPRFVAPTDMEAIFAGEADEEVPYKPEFDASAAVFDLKPGEVLSWPTNAPHRVTNLDSLNVSVSVPYVTESADRRRQIYCANRWLRQNLGVNNLSTRETGARAAAKRLSFRASLRLGLAKANAAGRVYTTRIRIDGGSPNGLREIPEGSVRTPF